jgi:hypothetical protein
MSILAQVNTAVEAYNRFIDEQVKRARSEPQFREKPLRRWLGIRESIETVTTPTGLKLPRLPLPATDESGEVARFLYGEGLPGEFPFVNAAYERMYQDSGEEPTRLFAGLGLGFGGNLLADFFQQ